jgi:photosystem II stability/assembly factor-like uncharacterized protein
MPSESFDQRLRAYLDRRSRHAGDPGAVDRVMATAFEGSSSHQVRRLFATIAIAAAVALVVATPITVFLLHQSPHTILGTPIARGSAQPSPRAPVTPTPTPSRSVPDAMGFWNAQRGLLIAAPACTNGGITCPGGLIERTTDGGKTWHLVDQVSVSLTAVALTGSDVAWVSEAGASCGVGGRCTTSILLLTTDGGTSWRQVHSQAPVFSVSPTSATSAWAVAPLPDVFSAGTGLMHSNDGGQTWQPRGNPCGQLPNLAPWAVSFAESVTGWVMCISGPATDMQPKALFATNNGGATWHLKSDACIGTANGQFIRNVGSLECVGYFPTLSFLPDGHGLMYAGRGTLTTTSDGGRTWASIAPDVVTNDVNEALSVGFVTDTAAFVLITNSEAHPQCPAAGCAPQLLWTHNSGRTWTVANSWVR